MRPDLLLDQSLAFLFQHPFGAAACGLAAGVLSWLVTRTRSTP